MMQRFLCFVLLPVTMWAALLSPQPPAAAQSRRTVVVIVAASLSASNVALGALRHAFDGYATDLNGTRLIPFNLAVGAPAREVLDRVLLGLSQDKVPNYWIDRKIRQGTDAPRSLPSAELAMRVVASLKGAIGYLEADPSSVPAALSVLAVDGKRPGDEDYPLTLR